VQLAGQFLGSKQTQASMKKSSAPLFALSTWLLLSATLGCGSSNRQLQSIATNSQGMTQFPLTATGTFSASPTTVSPLPVAWFQVGQTLLPPFTYKLTSQPLVTGCPTLAAVIAIAPTNPKAPSTGTLPEQVFEDLVLAHTTTSEGGFVASTPQNIACP
jgi:hypothetical protein